MYFFLYALLAASHKFGILYFPCPIIQNNLYCFCSLAYELFWSIYSLELYCLIFKHLEIPGHFLCFCWTLLWYEWNVVCIISVVSNLSEFVLWLPVWRTLVNVACALQTNMSSVLMEWTVPSISVRSSWVIFNDSWSTYLSVSERRDLELQL